MESQSKKNQVKHANMAVSCPYTFSVGSHNYQVFPLVTIGLLPQVLESIHKIYVLSTQHLIVRGSKNSKGGSGIIEISQKEKLFKFHKKLSAIWGNLTLYHPSMPLSKKNFLFPSVWPSREYIWHLGSPLSPQEEQKKDDEPFANHLQMYVSKTSTKAKKPALGSEHPSNELKIILFIQMENIFSQFIDKFLKIQL